MSVNAARKETSIAAGEDPKVAQSSNSVIQTYFIVVEAISIVIDAESKVIQETFPVTKTIPEVTDAISAVIENTCNCTQTSFVFPSKIPEKSK